jgi:hypothetical protein
MVAWHCGRVTLMSGAAPAVGLDTVEQVLAEPF